MRVNFLSSVGVVDCKKPKKNNVFQNPISFKAWIPKDVFESNIKNKKPTKTNLLDRDQQQQTILHMADEERIKEIVKLTQGNPSLMREVWLAKDFVGDTALFNANAKESNLLLKVAKEVPDLTGEFVLHKNDNGLNALASSINDLAKVKTIYKAVKDDPETAKKMVANQDNKGNLCFSDLSNPKVMKFIFESFKDEPEFLSELILTKNQEGNNAFAQMVKRADGSGWGATNTVGCVKVMLDFMKDKPDVIEKAFLNTNHHKEAAFRTLSARVRPEIFEYLKPYPYLIKPTLLTMRMATYDESDIQRYLDILKDDPESLKQALELEDPGQNNALQRAGAEGADMILQAIENIEGLAKELFLNEDQEGETALFKAVKSSDDKKFKVLDKFLRKYPELYLDCISRTNASSETVLHVSNPQKTIVLLDVLKDNKELREKLLFTRDNANSEIPFETQDSDKLFALHEGLKDDPRLFYDGAERTFNLDSRAFIEMIENQDLKDEIINVLLNGGFAGLDITLYLAQYYGTKREDVDIKTSIEIIEYAKECVQGQRAPSWVYKALDYLYAKDNK